ncbi:hypothetical protein FKM82_027765 [Ascaphus truei]
MFLAVYRHLPSQHIDGKDGAPCQLWGVPRMPMLTFPLLFEVFLQDLYEEVTGLVLCHTVEYPWPAFEEDWELLQKLIPCLTQNGCCCGRCWPYRFPRHIGNVVTGQLIGLGYHRVCLINCSHREEVRDAAYF